MRFLYQTFLGIKLAGIDGELRFKIFFLPIYIGIDLYIAGAIIFGLIGPEYSFDSDREKSYADVEEIMYGNATSKPWSLQVQYNFDQSELTCVKVRKRLKSQNNLRKKVDKCRYISTGVDRWRAIIEKVTR